jgi:tetratricopeptide (TPR) repeat protein
MAAGSRSSPCGFSHSRTKCSWYSKKANQLSWLVVAWLVVAWLVGERKTPACLFLSLLFVLAPLSTVGQTPDANRRTLIHGSIVTAQGQPVARATVEVRDLRGMKMATGFTDTAGSFAITTAAKPGEYVLLAAKELQIGDEQITLDQADREVTMALPFAAAVDTQQVYTVSVQALRVPAKASAHLKLAQEKFSKSNIAGAQREIDHALQVDSTCAAAFSMRALLRLSSRDFDGAIEDATRALALDPADANAYLALATAYNSVGEFQKAEAAAQQVLGMRPDFWQGRLEMAKALYGEGRLVLALHELDEVNRDFPDVHLVRANTLVSLTRREEAAQEFGLFLKEAPGDRRSDQIRRIVAGINHPATPASFGMVP